MRSVKRERGGGGGVEGAKQSSSMEERTLSVIITEIESQGVSNCPVVYLTIVLALKDQCVYSVFLVCPRWNVFCLIVTVDICDIMIYL